MPQSEMCDNENEYYTAMQKQNTIHDNSNENMKYMIKCIMNVK